jgi:hypothetical protein
METGFEESSSPSNSSVDSEKINKFILPEKYHHKLGKNEDYYKIKHAGKI